MKMRFLAVVLLVLIVAGAALAQEKGQMGVQTWPGEGRAARNMVAGKVTAVSAASITVDSPKGSQTFTVTDATNVMIKGVAAKIADIKVGDAVIIRFIAAQDGSRTARGIVVPKPRIAGKITAVNGNVLTVAGPNNKTWNVTLAQGAKAIAQKYVGTIADLKVGYGVTFEGDPEQQSFTVNQIGFRPNVMKGVVESVNANQMVVTSLRKQNITVTATDATAVVVRPRIGKNVKGTLGDVKKGAAVNIGGHVVGEAAMTALWVDILTTDQPNAGGQQQAAPREKAPGARTQGKRGGGKVF